MTSSQHFLELDYEEEFPPLKNDGSQYSSNEFLVSLEDTLAVPKYVREPMVPETPVQWINIGRV